MSHLDEASNTVLSDNDLLRSILNYTGSTGRHARWHLYLSEFELEISYKVKIKHQVSDALP